MEGSSLLIPFLAGLLVVYCVSGQGTGDTSGCPIGFDRHVDSCYHIFSTPTHTWLDAMAFCALYGHGEGSLATIESEDEQLFLEGKLKKLYPNPVGKDFWLGANDLVKEGTWVWVKRNEYVSEYTRWAPGEPNSGTSENCLAMYDGEYYHWNDAPCNMKEGFICEVPYIGQPTAVIG